VIPLEGRGVEVAVLLPADDLAHRVVRARVGRIDAGKVRLPAAGVVVVEQRGVGLRAAGRDAVARDELVDVLEARVLARVHHRAAVLGLRDPRAFMCRAARLTGVADGSYGSISTTQPKRFGSFGSFVASKRASNLSHW
jgi:hypothetical protein